MEYLLFMQERREAAVYHTALPFSSSLLNMIFSEGVLIHIISLLGWEIFFFSAQNWHI